MTYAACLLSLLLALPAVAASPGGYLFVAFKGEQTPMTEQIYFVVSQDGRDWQELNGGKPVLVSTVGEKGVRDPYLVRKPDGTFTLIATDLSIHLTNHNWGRAANRGSKSIVVWDSNDLVKWAEPRLVKVSADDAGCTWAPEAVYDDEKQDYLVFWASRNAKDSFKKFRIWAARTKDFKTFGEPFVYIDRPYATIDTTIVRDSGTYYRFTKNEDKTLIVMEKSKTLLGDWQPVPGFSLAKTKGYEGPECYVLRPAEAGKPATWCLVMDLFTQGAGYKPFVTHDLARGQFEPGPGFKFPFKLRHGAVLPVSAEELKALRTAYP